MGRRRRLKWLVVVEGSVLIKSGWGAIRFKTQGSFPWVFAVQQNEIFPVSGGEPLAGFRFPWAVFTPLPSRGRRWPVTQP